MTSVPGPSNVTATAGSAASAPVRATLRVLPADERAAIDVKVHVNTFEGVRLVVDTGAAFWLLDVDPAVAAYLAGALAAASGVTFG